MDGKTEAFLCEVCGVALEPMEAQFSYLGRDFRHTVLRCPVCGIVYIPEELAAGRMREVDTALEDK
jgi:rubredoxin